MEPNLTTSSNGVKTSALDFFLHLGSIVALYVVVGNFVNLLFRIIDKAFPDAIRDGISYTMYSSYSDGSGISLPVATLIIVFPIFVILSKLIYKTYAENSEKKHLAVRKWLTYVTLFFAGIFLAGDLVTVLYRFLDGQDLTTAFLLKALTVLIVSGAVFGFYLQDIRERLAAKSYKIWAIVVGVLILLAIIFGFSVLGSPKTQRLLREDSVTMNDLYNIEQGVITYWIGMGFVSETLPQNIYLSKNLEDYTYKKTGEMSFEICATFNFSSSTRGEQQGMMAQNPIQISMYKTDNVGNNWDHEAGYQCFERQIDPALYPTKVRG